MGLRLAVALALFVVLGGGCGAPVEVRRVALGGAHVLFVDFDGATIAAGGSDDAVAGISALGSASVPPFAAAVVAPDVDPARVKDVLVNRVRTMYLPWDVDVVDLAPSSGDYARVVVGGTNTVLTPAAPNGSAGIATLDCGNAAARSIGFAFSDEASPKFGGPVALAATIAHEAGHGYGLEHVLNPKDPMYAAGIPQQTIDDLFHYAFGSGNYSTFVAGGGTQLERCGRADPIDDVAILDAALGTRVLASAPPTVAVEFPPAAVVSVPTMLPLRIAASDDIAIRRVEVYRDLVLVAVLTGAPWELTLTLPQTTSTRITVEAVDDDAERATTWFDVQVDPSAPAPCDDTVSCVGALDCLDNRCVVATSDDAGGANDAGTGTHSGGCAMALTSEHQEENIYLLAFLGALASWRFLCAARRQRSRDRSW